MENSIRERFNRLYERLDETQLITIIEMIEKLCKFEEYAEEDEEMCNEMYDRAKNNDDGYRISSDELRKEYGI
jgi:hypothetical protein